MYSCKTCKKEWMHRIKACIYCGSALIEENPDKLKVVNCVKVTIPSMHHTEVPYYAIEACDESARLYFRKSMTEKKEGDLID